MVSFESAAASAIALAVLSGCCVLMRFVVRIAFVKHVGPDDALIALAWAASIALAAVTYQQHASTVTSSSDGDEASMTALLRQSWSSSITYNLAVLLLKDSLLLQYLRFSIDVGYRRACWALGTIVTAYGLSALFVGIFSCQPVAYSWNSHLQNGKCVDFLAFWLFNASFNSATDIIVCVLPIPVLKALHLPRTQMAILSSIFALGAFVCTASVVRLTAVYTATVDGRNDPSIAVWSTVEVNFGIMCACLPSFRHPMAQLWPRILAVRRRRLNSASLARHPAGRTDTKYPESVSLKSVDPNRSSTNSDASYHPTSSQPNNENNIEAGYITADIDTGGPTTLDGPAPPPSQPPHGSNSTPAGPLTSHSVSSPSITTVGATVETPIPTTTTDKPLPPPPQPTVPLPAARPGGPRALNIVPATTTTPSTPPRTTSSSSRCHKFRRGPRSLSPMACIPESRPQSQSRPRSRPPSRHHSPPSRRDGDIYTSTSVTTVSSPRNDDSSSPSRAVPVVVIPPASPIRASHPTSPPSTSLSRPLSSTSRDSRNSHDSTSSNYVAPWNEGPDPSPSSNSCPTASSRTYSYEILGGPQALVQDDAGSGSDHSPSHLPPGGLSTSASRREAARREKERARRKLREREREDERLRERDRQKREGGRPRGPREMRASL